MADWEKLTKEFDEVIDNITDKDFIKWRKDRNRSKESEFLFKLEYNPIRGTWNYNRGGHKENTYGWYTITGPEKNHKLNLFISFMDKFFCKELQRTKNTLPVSKVKQEWEKFCYLYNSMLDF